MVGTPAPLWALVGVTGDDIEPVGADLLGDQPTFLVAGPSRSGRSTALSVMAESLLRGGTEVVIGAPMNSPLRGYEGRPGVRGVVTDEEPPEGRFAELLEPGEGPVVLVVDDAEVWRDLPCRDWLKAFVRKASGNNRGVILGGDIATMAAGFSGWQSEVKKNRRGVLLSPPTMSNGDLVGVRLSRSQIAARVVPGAALLHLGDGLLMTTQIPSAAPAGPARSRALAFFIPGVNILILGTVAAGVVSLVADSVLYADGQGSLGDVLMDVFGLGMAVGSAVASVLGEGLANSARASAELTAASAPANVNPPRITWGLGAPIREQLCYFGTFMSLLAGSRGVGDAVGVAGRTPATSKAAGCAGVRLGRDGFHLPK